MLFTLLKVSLMILEVLVSVMLIGVILLQRTKSQGAGGLAFGAGMGEQIFGTQAGNVLTRTTVVLASIFLLNTAALTRVYSSYHKTRSVVESANLPSLPQPVAPVGTPMETPPAGPAAAAPADPTPQPAPAAP
jgi:preprotein translocase subunit SecG